MLKIGRVQLGCCIIHCRPDRKALWVDHQKTQDAWVRVNPFQSVFHFSLGRGFHHFDLLLFPEKQKKLFSDLGIDPLWGYDLFRYNPIYDQSIYVDVRQCWGPGRYSWEFLVGVLGVLLLTLFQTKRCHFHTSFLAWPLIHAHSQTWPLRNYVIITSIRTATKKIS